jgi:signal transduction histidine kinase/DNA-binding response OmpR family regulator
VSFRSAGEATEGGTVAELIRSRKDWGALGHPDAWPQSLRTILRVMLASRYAMWLGWGPDFAFFYNDAYREQTLGKKHPWALGRPASEVWAEIWETIAQRIDHVMATGEATWDEGLLLFLERNGYPEETYHTFSYSVAPGDDGRDGGLFCVVIEETERVIGERRLQLLKDLATLLGDAKGSADVLGAVERCLAADSREFVFSLAYLFDADEKEARRVVHSVIDDQHAAAPPIVVLSEPGSPWPLRDVLMDGEARVVPLDPLADWPATRWGKPPAHAIVLPIARQGEGHPAGVLIAGLSPYRPLDEGIRSFARLFVGHVAAALSNAKAYEEQKQRAEALAELDRAKTTFFSNVSHEFRTPLTLMLAPIEDLRATPGRDAQERDQLDLLHRNALRLLKLVNTLLEFSRLEAGRVEATYEPTDLAAFTRDLASSFRSAVERAGIELRVDCRALPEPVYVDRTMWEKIVLNLLSNALKFTFEGSIGVTLRGEDDGAILEVADTGIGIAEDELPRLFERFHRIEGARSRSHEGSGIGLALVQELARIHGGDVRVRSQVGRGTTLTVRVPGGTSHLQPNRIQTRNDRPSAAVSAEAYVEEALRWLPTTDGAASSAPSTSAPRERIVFADDNADMRTYVTRVLIEHWDVECVPDGQAALAAIRANPPDLVLADVMMPGLDGFGLLRGLRSDVALRAIPVVLLSARAGEEATAEGLRAGADDYVVKPFTARDLVVRLSARLTAVRAAREATEQRQNLYRHFMQAPFPIGVFRGPEHTIELANEATLRVWGKSASIIGSPLLEGLPELRGQPFIDLLDDVYRTGCAYEGRGERAQLPSGPGGELQDVYFNYVYAPLFDAQHNVEGILLSAFDVTPQVRSAEQVERARARAEELAATLRVTAQRLEAAQRVAGIGIFDWDLRQPRAYWSPELYALMGRAADADGPTSDEWIDTLVLEDRERGWGALQRAVVAREEAMEVEVRLRQPGGGSRWVRVSARIIYGSAGEPTRLIGAVVDVQVLKEAAAARAAALADAERTGRAKDEFLATMSHELRTPLNAMLGWSRILLKDPRDPAKVERGLTVIERNAVAQTRLVSDLLDVSRIISGKLRLALQPVDLAAVIGAAIDVVRPAADAKDVRLIASTEGLGTVVADPDRVQQVVWNLLVNAVRFTPAQGSVRTTATRAGAVVRIVVDDTGAGIPSEHLPHIFERFRQVDASTTRAHGGLGLGLAIVRYLVEAHGGTVDAKSAGVGTGATFTVTLPVRATTAPGAADEGARADSGRGRSTASPGVLREVRALVVDDDADSLDLAREILVGAGASVDVASGAREALEAPGPYDIVISDIGMPEMDGYALMRLLRAQERSARVPGIALTAYARAEDAAQAIRAGFQEHLSKPIDAGQLIDTVRKWTRGSGRANTP